MPMIDITLTQGALTKPALSKLVNDLTKALIDGEGAPDNEYTRFLTWCFVDERPPEAISVGGSNSSLPRYRVTLTVPEGAPKIPGPLMMKSRRALSKNATELVLDAEGSDYSFENISRVWVQIREIKEGYWGAFGDIATMNDIGTFVMGQPAIGHKTQKATVWRDAYKNMSVKSDIAEG